MRIRGFKHLVGFSLLTLLLVLLSGCSSHTTAQKTARSSQSVKKVSQVTTKSDPYAHWQSVKTVKLPILMYHSISSGNALKVPATEFKAEMTYLKQHHYRTLTTTEAVYALSHHRIPQSKIVWITLDDSYTDNKTAAWPILKANHQHATINFITGFATHANHLTLADAKQMQASQAIDFQSHTVRHLDLNSLTYQQQLTEMTASKRWLDQKLHQKTTVICYPAGRANQATVRAAKKAGYRYALSTAPGIATSKQDHYNLTRQRVTPGMSLTTFATLLN
ncbi:polysaccharide deacetylase family protein [Lactiplantibacillus sp. WILCCON 0030]|uniref:Polysaccharide deacetylase family protein n=1 Tax=Lactiplantibacillus brownii TaxID=3069269 RepID=A0ABU1AA79_9LACO|nr:polysaccharide deacetylase family protein [Lactiplantibacillus brownii]MDQ7937842.1 polysaccharide deacetylase family protein [Lactiplantibacillus brownii]